MSALIEKDKATIAQLKQTLQQESEALKTRAHSELPRLIEEKNQWLQALEHSSGQRAQILKASSLPTTKEAWEALLVDVGDQQIQNDWQSVQTEFKQCHTMNEVNGKLISRSRNTLGHLVNLLKGQDSTPELYNQSGGRQANSGAYTMVKA